MAKGNKTGGKDFKPGQSGNPNGRPPIPEDIKSARQLNQVEFERTVNSLMEKNKEQLTAILKDPKTPALVMLVARIVRTAMWSADTKRLDFLLNRMVGKPRTQEPLKPGGSQDVLTFIDLVIQAEKGGRRGNA